MSAHEHLGVRVSIFDAAGEEVRALSAWAPPADELHLWRPMFDSLCASLWHALQLEAHTAPPPTLPPSKRP